MNGLLKQKYALALLLAILMAMGLTYWFGIWKTVRHIRDARDEIQKMLVIRENRNHQLARLEEYRSQYEAILRDEKWFDAFTARERMIEFVRRLESLAEENGVVVTLEAREAPKAPLKKVTKPAASAEKTNEKGDDEGGSAVSTKDKPEKKETSILEGLSSFTYTLLGLRVTGKTENVIRYLQRVETLPVALDVVALEAVRKENLNFSDEEVLEPIRNQEEEVAVLVTPEEVLQGTENPFSLQDNPTPETHLAQNAFELEVNASLVVYHPKE
jgi:hypothetical protein